MFGRIIIIGILIILLIFLSKNTATKYKEYKKIREKQKR